MTAMIQIRNVPDALHRRLKSRAALAGMSLSDYLLSEIRQVAERPTLDELRALPKGSFPDAIANDRRRCFGRARSTASHPGRKRGGAAAVPALRDVARASFARR